MLAFGPWTTVKLQLQRKTFWHSCSTVSGVNRQLTIVVFFYFAAAQRATHIKREPLRAHWTHRRAAGVDLKRRPAQLNTVRSTLRPSLSLWRLSDTISSPETPVS